MASRACGVAILLTGLFVLPLQVLASGLEARKEYMAGNYQAALPLAQTAAEKGDTSAMVVLGMMYYKGQGVRQDYEAALKLWREAARKGNAKAQNNLGMAFQNGTGVDRDYAEAVKWYQLAAKKNYGLAYSNLGVLYRYGKGLDQDYRKSLEFLKKSEQILTKELATDPENATATRDDLAFVKAQIGEVSMLVQN